MFDLNELQQIEEMGNEVGDLLKSTQTNMSNHSMASRGIMLHEIIPTVSKARADLKKLRATLERIGSSTNARNSKGFEASGREANAIREMEESIERDIQAPKLSTGPKTGTSIVPNGANGVLVGLGAYFNTVGGSLSGLSNLISGNQGNGVDIQG